MRERIGIITGWTLIIIVFCVFISYAVPPTPPTVNITGNAATCTTANGLAANVPIVTDDLTATGGNVTGLTTLGATNATITSIKTAVAADNTLSGTPIIITIYDAASNTPYYFKAYPTKQ